MADVKIPQPDLVDREGNIHLHRREGAVIEIAFEDENGNPRDVTELPLFLEVRNKFRKELAAGLTSDKRMIILTQEETAFLNASGIEFVVREESQVLDGAVIPDVLWEGKMYGRGFGQEPS